MKYLALAAQLTGIGATGYGIWLIHEPAAYIVGGLFAVLFGVALNKGRSSP